MSTAAAGKAARANAGAWLVMKRNVSAMRAGIGRSVPGSGSASRVQKNGSEGPRGGASCASSVGGGSALGIWRTINGICGSGGSPTGTRRS